VSLCSKLCRERDRKRNNRFLEGSSQAREIKKTNRYKEKEYWYASIKNDGTMDFSQGLVK
jgi:hypothetical protein